MQKGKNKNYLCVENDIVLKNKLQDFWNSAIGLQKVDNCVLPSYLLIILSELNIKGKMSNKDVMNYLNQYYRYSKFKLRQEKANDLVASRIVEILSDDKFEFSIDYLKYIHKFLFRDIYKFAGKIRTKNIESIEEILNKDKIIFNNFYEILFNLKHEFDQEKKRVYNSSNLVSNIATFTSNIWMVHPFRDGNTRTISVFIQKYLMSLGIDFDCSVFKDNSLYFRNALVRSNYGNQDNSYLISFFENMLLYKEHDLDNKNLMLKK